MNNSVYIAGSRQWHDKTYNSFLSNVLNHTFKALKTLNHGVVVVVVVVVVAAVVVTFIYCW